MTPERILLVTPLKGGLSPEYVVNLIAVLRSNSKGRYLWEWQIRTGTSVALARNELVVPVVVGKFDRCVFWDADVGDTDPNMMMAMFYRLLSHDVDVVAAAYVARTLKSYFHGGKVEGAMPNANGLMAMQQMPLGFSAIRTRAFTKIMEKFPERRYLMKQPEDSELPPNMFEFFPTGICGPCTGDGKVARIKDALLIRTKAGGINHDADQDLIESVHKIINDTAYETNYMLGEDFYFCKLAREAGVNLWLDNNLVVPHETTLRLPLHSNEMLDALEEEWRHDINAPLDKVKEKISELRALMAKD